MKGRNFEDRIIELDRCESAEPDPTRLGRPVLRSETGVYRWTRDPQPTGPRATEILPGAFVFRHNKDLQFEVRVTQPPTHASQRYSWSSSAVPMAN
jgi:hypothetical protein